MTGRHREGIFEYRILIERIVFNCLINSGQILKNSPTGPNGHVPYFGITHLIGGQTDVNAGSGYQGTRGGSPEFVPVRRAGLMNRIMIRGFAVSPAVEDNENRGRHVDEKPWSRDGISLTRIAKADL